MAKLSFGAYPHMLGFEQLEQLLERTAKSSNEGYPPFNIEQTSDRSFRISLATAGFSEADLSITLENRQLVIQGKKNQETGTKEFFFIVGLDKTIPKVFCSSRWGRSRRGIYGKWVLHIDLLQNIPTNVIQKIDIKTDR